MTARDWSFARRSDGVRTKPRPPPSSFSARRSQPAARGVFRFRRRRPVTCASTSGRRLTGTTAVWCRAPSPYTCGLATRVGAVRARTMGRSARAILQQWCRRIKRRRPIHRSHHSPMRRRIAGRSRRKEPFHGRPGVGGSPPNRRRHQIRRARRPSSDCASVDWRPTQAACRGGRLIWWRSYGHEGVANSPDVGRRSSAGFLADCRLPSVQEVGPVR